MNKAELKAKRKLLGLSIQEAAQMSGLKIRTWQAYESGEIMRVGKKASEFINEKMKCREKLIIDYLLSNEDWDSIEEGLSPIHYSALADIV